MMASKSLAVSINCVQFSNLSQYFDIQQSVCGRMG